MPTFGCAICCKFGAIYGAQKPVCAMWIVVPTIYNVITDPYIWALIFSWRNLCCYWKYHDNSMRLILIIWCQIQRTSSSLRYVNCGAEIYNAITAPPIQASIYKWKYLLWYWIYIDNSMCVIWHTWCQHTAHQSVYAVWTVVPDIYNVVTSPHIQASVSNRTYLRCYWRYIENSMRLILQTWCQIQRTSSSLRCELWSRPYTM
jgi:hypothetical protein